MGALAMSEPGAGSDVVGMRCRADARDGAFVLNGTKMWCTNGTVADTLVVYAKTQADAGAHGITALVIEKGMKVGMASLRACGRFKLDIFSPFKLPGLATWVDAWAPESYPRSRSGISMGLPACRAWPKPTLLLASPASDVGDMRVAPCAGLQRRAEAGQAGHARQRHLRAGV